ncbi:FlgD immunoglobulin-like domain containing protein [Roseofilum casamattae]|uniref:FlgD immunoglobulin-like domain containing protein n=1 Tax=Roseofilum casamattae BLCC-M143 TaxID=3022442 RepID=A0ABT7C2H7_9CYAN|nr:FlgD immunoglobulin-like domain containing protein [Roseofilum casamattae]MDJ1185480.1 FlgD immunoglobulin-like domain containing protein [Roseofilum casamattae BLCC-M143]
MIRFFPGRNRTYGAILLFCLGLYGCQNTPTLQTPVPAAQSLTTPQERHLEFTLSSDRRLSLSIFDDRGTLVRELLRGEWYAPGTHQVVWDGLDSSGNPAPAGKYTWKQVNHPGFTSRYITHIGVNPPSESYHLWPGDHTGVGTIAVDESGVYFGARLTEVPPMVAKHSLDGTQQLWTKEQYYQGGRLKRLAVSQGKVYLLKDEGAGDSETHWIRAVSAETGTPAGDWQIADGGVQVADLDSYGENLAIALPDLGEIRWLDPENPTTVLATVRGLPGVNAITAVSGDRQGTVLVHSNGSVLRVDPVSGIQETTITGLQGVVAIDLDHRTGDLYLNETSKGAQVWRYDRSLTKIREYGAEQRPFGVYQKELFGNIADVTADLNGGFYTTEPGRYPRQTSHINSADGSLIDSWFGGLSYYLVPSVDPQDPSIIWLTGHVPEVVKIKIDVDRRTWDILEVYSFAEPGDKLFVDNRAIGSRWQPVYRDNQLYLMATKRPAILRVDRDRGQLIPVSLTTQIIYDPNSDLWRGSGEDGFPAPWVNAARAQGFADLSQAPKYFSWGDRNENGMMDAEEFQLYPPEFTWNFVGEGVWDEQFNYYLPTQHFGGSDPQVAWHKIPVIEWVGSNSNIPIYNLEKTELGAPIPPEVNDFYWGRQLTRDDRGNIYIVSQSHLTVHESLGGRWPSTQNRVNRLIKWNETGELVGLFSRKVFDANEKDSGKLFYPMHVRSGPDNTIIVVDQDYTPAAVYTEDGLFIGPLLDKPTADGLPDSVYRASHHQDFQGFALMEFADGRRFWIGPQTGGLPVYETLGWDKLATETGSLIVDNPVKPLSLSGTGLTGKLYNDGQGTSQLGEFQFPGMDIEHYRPSPISEVDPDDFQMILEGQLQAIFSEEHQFYLYLPKPEDSGKIWIGEQLVFDSSSASNPVPKIFLESGKKYPIKVEWNNRGGKPTLRLIWTSTTLDPEVIPARVLYPK